MKERLIRMVSSLPVALLMLGLLAGGGYAAWVTYFERGSTITVTSDPIFDVIVTAEFTGDAIDVSAGPLTATDSISLQAGSNVNFPVSWVTTYEDVSDECVNYESDCSTSVMLDGTYALTSGDSITMNEGETKAIVVNVECAQHSCPQTVETVFTFGA